MRARRKGGSRGTCSCRARSWICT
uniref:Uncharacterized protein n=1 Tax=Arundo donax TaxID=35708 RepID=A0A0A9B5R1_ARUDO